MHWFYQNSTLIIVFLKTLSPMTSHQANWIIQCFLNSTHIHFYLPNARLSLPMGLEQTCLYIPTALPSGRVLLLLGKSDYSSLIQNYTGFFNYSYNAKSLKAGLNGLTQIYMYSSSSHHQLTPSLLSLFSQDLCLVLFIYHLPLAVRIMPEMLCSSFFDKQPWLILQTSAAWSHF